MSRQFIAIDMTNTPTITSGLHSDRHVCDRWAADRLGSKPGCKYVLICETVAKVERETPVIKVTEIDNIPETPVLPKPNGHGSVSGFEYHHDDELTAGEKAVAKAVGL